MDLHSVERGCLKSLINQFERILDSNGVLFEDLDLCSSSAGALRHSAVRARTNRLDHEEGACRHQRTIQGSTRWDLRARPQCQELFRLC